MKFLNFQEIAQVCLFIACKSEETAKKLHHIINTAAAVQHPNLQELDPDSPVRQNSKSPLQVIIVRFIQSYIESYDTIPEQQLYQYLVFLINNILFHITLLVCHFQSGKIRKWNVKRAIY